MATATAAPEISQQDLFAFHAAHFSAISVGHFGEQFLGPVEEEDPEAVDDDGLGYYEDGVKRTLTEEQVRIFRHSEIQALLRDRRHAEEAIEHAREGDLCNADVVEEELEDGELGDCATIPEATTPPASKNERKSNRKATKAHKARQRGAFKPTSKPDLRKRTWDKVDNGVHILAYDEQERRAAPIPSSRSQRRRISYNDD